MGIGPVWGPHRDSHRNHQRAMDISNVLAVFFSMCFFFLRGGTGTTNDDDDDDVVVAGTVS